MSNTKDLPAFAACDVPVSDNYINELKALNFNYDDVIPVTVYDQQCLESSNIQIIRKLYLSTIIFCLNVVLSIVAILTFGNEALSIPIGVIEPVLNGFALYESSSPPVDHVLTGSILGIAWLIISCIASIFIIAKNINHIVNLENQILKFGTYLQIDSQPVIPAESVILNSNISNYLKPILVLTAIISINASIIGWEKFGPVQSIDKKTLEGEIGQLVNSSTNYHASMYKAQQMVNAKYSGPTLHFMKLQILMKYEPIIDPVEFKVQFIGEVEALLSTANLKNKSLNDLRGDKNKEVLLISQNSNFNLISLKYESLI